MNESQKTFFTDLLNEDPKEQNKALGLLLIAAAEKLGKLDMLENSVRAMTREFSYLTSRLEGAIREQERYRNRIDTRYDPGLNAPRWDGT